MTYYKVELSSNGMLPNYPRFIWIGYILLKHWKDLYIASKGSSDAFEDVLTGVLDSVIDWDKTGFIKTSDKLTLPDRQKLFFWQRINCKGPEVTLLFKCGSCGELNEVKVDLTTINEDRIKQKIKNEKIEINDVKYNLKVPVREDLLKLNKLLNEYKFNAFKKLSNYLYINEIETLNSELDRVNNRTNVLILEKMKSMKTNEIEEIKKDANTKREEIKNKIQEYQNKTDSSLKEVNDILGKFYLKQLNSISDIKSYKDLEFDDPYTNYLVSLILCIENYPEENIVNFMLNIPGNILKILEQYVSLIYHGFEKSVKTECVFCKDTIFRKLDLTPDFFLT